LNFHRFHFSLPFILLYTVNKKTHCRKEARFNYFLCLPSQVLPLFRFKGSPVFRPLSPDPRFREDKHIGAPLSLENQYLLFGDFTHLPAENKSNPAPVRKFPFPYRPCN
jgi:hypothetical protein